jgi:RNA polymerase sigma-70 factor, ECF subfamily
VTQPWPDQAEPEFSLFERLHQPFLLWWSNPEREFVNKLLREDLERAIDGLPEIFRLVVVFSEVEGLSYQDIARSLSIPVGTVRSRLSRGRSLLQKALWQHGQEAGLNTGRSRKRP